MSLNMYLGEVQAQTESMNASCTAIIQSMEQTIDSIDAFIGDAVLQGKTYDSAKMFFLQTFRPLAQGIIYLCEELIHQNNAFPADFQAEVATVDVVEQEILEQIRELERMIAEVQSMSAHMSGMDALLQVYYAMKRKLEDKLQRLYQFNASSSDNYATALELAANIARGLAEVQSGKGFSTTSGTFSTKELNMDWAKPIQVITEEKMRKAEEERIKDESLLDKFKDAVEDGVEAMEKLIHTTEDTPIIGQLYNYKKGQDEAVIDGLKGLVNTVLHPIDSFESAIYALSHPKETFNSVKQAIRDSWNQEVINGDWNSRAKWLGNMHMQVALSFVGTKGIDKISKVGKVSKVDEPSKINESVNFIQSVKNVLNPDKYKQFIHTLNNILAPRDQLAFEGGGASTLKSNFGDIYQESKDKLSPYQYTKSTEDGDIFVGKLYGEDVPLKDVNVDTITYTKRSREEAAQLRKDFKNTVRKQFLYSLATDPEKVLELKKAGIPDFEIENMKKGKNPSGWQVHHNLPLDDGGTNAFENLTLIQNHPYHKAITNTQNTLTKGLVPGDSIEIDWAIPKYNIYPKGE